MKDKFCFSDLLTKSYRTEIQTYKVEERTFGTPCICYWFKQTGVSLLKRLFHSRDINLHPINY